MDFTPNTHTHTHTHTHTKRLNQSQVTCGRFQEGIFFFHLGEQVGDPNNVNIPFTSPSRSRHDPKTPSLPHPRTSWKPLSLHNPPEAGLHRYPRAAEPWQAHKKAGAGRHLGWDVEGVRREEEEGFHLNSCFVPVFSTNPLYYFHSLVFSSWSSVSQPREIRREYERMES